jgi:hypothetical protein
MNEPNRSRLFRETLLETPPAMIALMISSTPPATSSLSALLGPPSALLDPRLLQRFIEALVDSAYQ